MCGGDATAGSAGERDGLTTIRAVPPMMWNGIGVAKVSAVGVRGVGYGAGDGSSDIFRGEGAATGSAVDTDGLSTVRMVPTRIGDGIGIERVGADGWRGVG